jgi:ribosomal protein L11 methylase PrmA
LFIARILVDGDPDVLLAELNEAGTLGVTELEDGLWEAWFTDEATARRFSAEVSAAPATDWSTTWQAAWVERLVGERLYLAPPWSAEPTPGGRLRLEYRAGMACGTGEHPGTRLALMGLELAVRPGDHILDVGTGSGLLTDAAWLLGAGRVTACDIEEPDVRLARAAGAGDFFVGSARSLRAGVADVVVANINAAALRMLLPDLRRVLRKGGRLVLSGFRPGELALEGSRELDLEGWRALLL